MISHRIYHIPGVKVGCTKNTLQQRQAAYPKGTKLLLLEELHDCTDATAGDREFYWADRLGYRRFNHYTVILNASEYITPEQRIEMGHKGGTRTIELGGGFKALTSAQQTVLARRGGRKAVELGVGVHALTPAARAEAGRRGGTRAAELGLGIHALTTEQRSEFGRMAGAAAAATRTTGAYLTDRCPYCGIVSNRMILHRRHFDNCPHKPPKITWWICRPSAQSYAEPYL